jgi:hypothetical protein
LRDGLIEWDRKNENVTRNPAMEEVAHWQF